jgi:hypothetical protein
MVKRVLVDWRRGDRLPHEVDVEAFDANHCPGALVFVFSGAAGNVVHTGDFRYCRAIDPVRANLPASSRIGSALGRKAARQRNVELGGAGDLTDLVFKWRGRIDRLFLDNTFCNDKYEFPSQSDSAVLAAKHVRATVSGSGRSALLFGAYTIGKEKFADRCRRLLSNDAKLYVSAEKFQSLSNCELATRLCATIAASQNGVVDTSALEFASLSADGDDTREVVMFMVPMGSLTQEALCKKQIALSPGVSIDLREFASIVGIRGTGWAMTTKQMSLPAGVHLINIPYSEHCGFTELLTFVQDCEPKAVVPTVNAKSFKQFEPRFVEVCPRLLRKGATRPLSSVMRAGTAAIQVSDASESDDSSVEIL